MLVSKHIFTKIAMIYTGYSEAEDNSVYLRVHRKQIRIIADTLWEQILENIFKNKPRNYTDAMFMINRHKQNLTDDDDITVVHKLYELLISYEVILDKNYMDISLKLLPIFKGAFKELCEALARHKMHVDILSAQKLLAMLERI